VPSWPDGRCSRRLHRDHGASLQAFGRTRVPRTHGFRQAPAYAALMQPSSQSRWFVAQSSGADSPGLRAGDPLDAKLADRITEAAGLIRAAVTDSAYSVCLRATEALEDGSGRTEDSVLDLSEAYSSVASEIPGGFRAIHDLAALRNTPRSDWPTLPEILILADDALDELERHEASSLLADETSLRAAIDVVRSVGAPVLFERSGEDQMSLHELPLAEVEILEEALGKAEALTSEAAAESPTEAEVDWRSVDFRSLAAHVAGTTSDLAEAWQRAMNSALNEGIRSALTAKWSSLMTLVVQGGKARSVELEELGLEIRHHELPPFQRQVSSLEHNPADLKTRVRQLEMAHLIVVERVAKAIGRVLQVEGSWDPESFSEAREHASLLADLDQRMSAARAAAASQHRSPALEPEAVRRIRQARRAWDRADSDGALLHALAAARWLIADAAGVDPDHVPSDYIERLARNGASASLAGMLALGSRYVDQLLADGRADIEIAIVVVPNLLSTLESFAATPPVAAIKSILGDSPR
jgi:hypothetical protein